LVFMLYLLNNANEMKHESYNPKVNFKSILLVDY
jgi:hypothetical protein